jgi:hypothetical protein
MKFKKVTEWEDHTREPGGDEVMLLEAVEVPPEQARYARLSWSALTDKEFTALENGEVVDLTYAGALTDRG